MHGLKGERVLMRIHIGERDKFDGEPLYWAIVQLLRQPPDNPVVWFPWGGEAAERRKRKDKPILLSIGYAACHWCHVMAHESFEDEGTARLMNDKFVNIKVDREERPDLDGIYMQAVEAMSGHGGLPLSQFPPPPAEPLFFGGVFS